MFIAVNKVSAVQNEEQKQAMERGFAHAMPGMQQFKGFLGFELWTQDDGSVLAVSRWESKEAMEEYTSNALFQHHHGGPKSESGPSAVTTYYEAKVLK